MHEFENPQIKLTVRDEIDPRIEEVDEKIAELVAEALFDQIVKSGQKGVANKSN